MKMKKIFRNDIKSAHMLNKSQWKHSKTHQTLAGAVVTYQWKAEWAGTQRPVLQAEASWLTGGGERGRLIHTDLLPVDWVSEWQAAAAATQGGENRKQAVGRETATGSDLVIRNLKALVRWDIITTLTTKWDQSQHFLLSLLFQCCDYWLE